MDSVLERRFEPLAQGRQASQRPRSLLLSHQAGLQGEAWAGRGPGSGAAALGAVRPHVPRSPGGSAGQSPGSAPTARGCQEVGARPYRGCEGTWGTPGRLKTSGEIRAWPPAPLPSEPSPRHLCRISGSRPGPTMGHEAASAAGAARSVPTGPPGATHGPHPARATSPAPPLPPRATRGTPVTSPSSSSRLPALSRKDAKVVTCPGLLRGCARDVGNRTSCGAAWWKKSPKMAGSGGAGERRT